MLLTKQTSRWLLGMVCCLLALTGAARNQRGAGVKALSLAIDGPITSRQVKAVRRLIEEADRANIRTLIIDLDTPGGYFLDSTQIADMLLKREDLRSVAFVQGNALSGGTIIALACSEIYMLPNGRLGDVAPVGPMPGVILGEKVQSPVRTVLRTCAKARGYPVALTEAMVTKESEVFEVQLQGDAKPAYMTRTDIENLPENLRVRILQRKLVVPAGQILTLDADEAVRYGFAVKVADRAEFLRRLGLTAAEVEPFTRAGVSGFLKVMDRLTPLMLAAGLILLFFEFATPGFAVPGVSGIILIVSVFVIKAMVGTATLAEVVLLAVGLGLIAIEVFLIPGFTVTGVAGILLTIIALVLSFQDFGWPSTGEQWRQFAWNIILVLGSLVMAGVGVLIVSRYAVRVPVFSKLVLTTDLGKATVAESVGPGGEALTGRFAVASTPLHPAGRVELGDQVLDVVTEGEFIERGTFVRIEKVEGPRIVVRAATPEEVETKLSGGTGS